MKKSEYKLMQALSVLGNNRFYNFYKDQTPALYAYSTSTVAHKRKRKLERKRRKEGRRK